MPLGHTNSLPLPEPLSIRHLPIKRFCDMILSGFLLIFFLPLLLVLALIVKLTSRGPVIYSDARVGRGGQFFRCYKFRTMYHNSEARLRELLKTDPVVHKQWHQQRKLIKDPRITRVGYWMRRTSLDELPQLWNTLIGDMSLVGPRPVTAEELQELYGAKAVKILQVRPGITGLWQISGRSTTSYSARIRLDEQYVDQRCLRLDLIILLKTIPAVLTFRGAY